jgi:hypothetical protein
MKFGKTILNQQIPEYAAKYIPNLDPFEQIANQSSYINYKALKKVRNPCFPR